MNELSRPKVSVSLITYNHADFIEQAIESVLMQETDFEYELVIGEDDSSDGTREIVQSYAEQYPDKIRLLLNDRVNVIYIDGRPTGRWNMVNTLQHCNGQYIAWLDGDDYWTDPQKLQKQTDFLDEHSECSMCYHNTLMVYQDRKHNPIRFNLPVGKKTYSLKDLLKGNFIHLSSVLYRNKLFSGFPDWFCTVAVGDWPLFIMIAQYGDIGYINEIMSIYRVWTGSIHSHRRRIRLFQEMIETSKVLNRHFDYQYDRTLRSLTFLYRFYIAKDKGDWTESILNLLRCVAVSPFNNPVTSRHLFMKFQYHFNTSFGIR